MQSVGRGRSSKAGRWLIVSVALSASNGGCAVATPKPEQPTATARRADRYPGFERTLEVGTMAFKDGIPKREPLPVKPSGPPAAAPRTAVAAAAVSNAATVIAGLRPGYRACYRQALAEDPQQQGTITLHLHVSATGNVSIVWAQALGLDKAVVDCVLARSALAAFDPPEGGSAEIKVPVTFVKN